VSWAEHRARAMGWKFLAELTALIKKYGATGTDEDRHVILAELGGAFHTWEDEWEPQPENKIWWFEASASGELIICGPRVLTRLCAPN
jgi:hypothetical protein